MENLLNYNSNSETTVVAIPHIIDGESNSTAISIKENELARITLVAHQKIVLLALIGILTISGFVFGWHTLLLVLISIAISLYFIDLLFNFFLIMRSFYKEPEITVTKEEIQSFKTKWPTYTIFCPLYKEANILPQFIKAMSKIEYPEESMEVMLLLEEDDVETIEAARTMKLPSTFKILVVPHSFPKTKPKALNYALNYAQGEFAVVFDAEDVPDPLQLKKAVLAFRKIKSNVICIQAKLNFYNPTHNILTRVFTAEYSLWFDLVLTGLQSINAPIPLGGTSNHFRTKDLQALSGWDPFNVTEDCDLGIRLFKKGYRTAIINSTTLEEANSSIRNWFRQRSRWIKGYIQTYFVHMRNPKEFISDWKNPHVLSFQLIVGGKILSMFLNPLMWILTIMYFAFRATLGRQIESLFITPIFYIGIFSLVVGNFLYFYYYILGCIKRQHYNIVEYAYLVPFYWLMMSAAAWIAVYQLIFKPHYWEKTIHGLHLNQKNMDKKMAALL